METMTDRAQALMMAQLARMLDAKVIVEAGTHMGSTAVTLALENPTAVVRTADINRPPKMVGWPPNLHFHLGDFGEMVSGMKDIDLAYIDATGPGRYTRLRWEHAQIVLPKMAPHGIICFDDTLTEWDGVAEIRDLCQINIHALKGLGIYQCP